MSSGHHLQGHTLEHGGSRPTIELEADKFSGFVLYKLGATLEQAEIGMITLGSDRGSSTHPSRKARLAAIESGWAEARDLNRPDSNPHPQTTKPLPTEVPGSVLDILKNAIWLEHDVYIQGEVVYLEFELNGKVRTRAPSDTVGYVPSNVSWHIVGDTLYVERFNPDTKELWFENQGTVKSDRIEGTYKDPINNVTGPWLLTRVKQIPR